VPCSGAIYLAVLGLLETQTTRLEGAEYLLLYNLIFALPLLVLLAARSSRPVFNCLGRWQLHHRGELKVGLSTSAAVLGLMLLATL
jgi:cytochrome c-type biogenesis protein